MGSARDQTELCIIQMSKGNDGRKYKIIGSARASAYFCLRLIRRRTTAQLEIKRKRQTSLNEITEVTYGSSLNLRVGRIERKNTLLPLWAQRDLCCCAGGDQVLSFLSL